jgi:hypothetical protein
VVQTTPQLPQFFRSDFLSTHAPLQYSSGAVQMAAHLPASQVSSDAHVVMHEPQCASSAWRSLQTPLQ